MRAADFYDGLDVEDNAYQVLSDSTRAPIQNNVVALMPARQDAPIVPRHLNVIENGLTEEEIKDFINREAMRQTLTYFKTYVIPDGSFQAFEDLVVYLDSGQYELLSDPSFSQREMLYALEIYGGGFSLYYFLVALAQGESLFDAAWGAIKFGIQFWFFYFLDKPFDVDWVSASETLPNVAMVIFLMVSLCYVLDTGPDVAYAYFTSDEPEWNDQLKQKIMQIMRKNLGESAGVGIGTAGWLLPYYLPIDGVVGYTVKAVAEGVVANALASLLVYHYARQDIAAEVANGKIQPKTLQQEIEEKNRPRVSFCTRASNYFCSWIFKAERNEVRRDPVLAIADDEEDFVALDSGEEADHEVQLQSQSKSKSKLKPAEQVPEVEFSNTSSKKRTASF